jgi:hypothetical protein
MGHLPATSSAARPRAWRACVAAACLLAASCSGSGQPDAVVRGFYDAALGGNTAGAQALLTEERAAEAAEILRAATRTGELQRVDILSVDVWSEHGAVCLVRKSFADGATEVVRLDVTRERGDWKLAAGEPGF